MKYTVTRIIAMTTVVHADNPHDALMQAAHVRSHNQQQVAVGTTVLDESGVIPSEIPLGNCPVSTGEGMNLERCRDFCGHPCTWLQDTDRGAWCLNPHTNQP